jgi:NTE family protein
MNGLVLQGGGTKGSYHIGVWKALRELGEEIHAVTGTSIGALNGVMIAQDKFEEVYNIWYNIKPSMLSDIDSEMYKKLLDLELDSELFSSSIKYFKDVFNNRGLDITPFKELVEREVDEEKVRNSKVDFGLVTVSLSDMEPIEVFVEDIPKGKLHEYIIASARLPIFRMERIDGKVFIDGGFYDNQPIKLMLTKKGIKKLILVENKGIGMKQKVDLSELEVIRIKPSGDVGRTLEITIERSRENLLMGYYDTLRVYQEYAGKKYCIEPYDEKIILEYLYSMPENKINSVAKILGFKKIKSKRKIFEQILPEIAGMLKLNKNADYEELFTGIIEMASEYLEINRYQIFTIQELLNQIKEKLIENEKEIFYDNQKLISKILKQGNIAIGKHKNEIIVEIMSVLLVE